MRSLEGDIVVVVVVMVVVSVGMRSSTVSSSVECLCGERRLERIPAKRPPRASDGRERRSEAAPTTARASSSRGCAVAAESQLRLFGAAGR